MATDKLLKLSQIQIIKADSDESYDAKGAASGVLGTADDTASANTVYGAKKKAEEEAAAVLGTAADTASSNTVYGAKAKAEDVQSAITGSASDTAESLTLNGLKKAVAAAAANIPDDVVTEDELTGKGYQTATNVTAAIEGYGYQTSGDVQAAINAALASLLDWKGAKATVADLPSTDNKKGDVWHVNATGSEYAWNGEAWEELGFTFDPTGYVTTDDIVYATDDEVRAALGQTVGE